MRSWQYVTAALLASSLLQLPAQGLFEEQAGQQDWHLPMIGRVSLARFALRGRTRVFVASDEAVVACLDARSGSLLWRQVLPEAEVVQQMAILQKPAAIVTLSTGSRKIRAWSSGDGTLLWEHSPELAAEDAAPGQLVVLPDADANATSRLALIIDGKAEVLAGSIGRVLGGQAVDPSSHIVAVPLAQHAPTADAALFKLDARSTGVELEYWMGGAVQGRHAGAFNQPMESIMPAGDDSLAALSQDGRSLCLMTGIASSHKLACISLGDLSMLKGKVSLSQVAPPHLGGLVGISSSHGGSALLLADGKSVKVLAQHPGSAVFLGAVEVGDDFLVGILARDSSEQVTGSLTSCASGAVISSLSLNASAVDLHAKLMYASAGPGTHIEDLRILLSFSDGTLMLASGPRLLWAQDQGLAAIQQALFIDLPAPSRELAAAIRESAPTLKDRLNIEFIALKDRFGVAQPEDAVASAAIKTKLNTRLWPSRDAEGFRKQILIVSRYGKVFALHSGDGRVLWGRTFEPSPQRQLLSWRVPHDAQQPPHFAVVSAQAAGVVIAVLEAHSGKIVSTTSLSLDSTADAVTSFRVIPAGSEVMHRAYDQHMYYIVNANLASPIVQLVPDLPGTARHPTISFWTLNNLEGVLQGYEVKHQSSPDLVWTLNPQAEGTILSVATKLDSDAIYSHAKILGDRSLKLKYLNPNVILVALGKSGRGTDQDAALTILIVDAVTGHVLHRQSHQGARGPVHAVLSEHWVVYHFWSLAHHRYEMAVMELYDATPRDLSIGSMLLGSQNSSTSAYAPPAIEVLTQSFLVKAGVRSLAATSSLRGISTKQVIMATDHDQMYLMDKRFLDPRRPKGKPTPEDQAEMLPPYEPELPMVAEYVASHRRSIARIAGFASSPAALESTALVIAYGLDVFMTTVQPSKTFDLIPDDFPYALLLAITVVLAIAFLACRRLEGSVSTSKKWA